MYCLHKRIALILSLLIKVSEDILSSHRCCFDKNKIYPIIKGETFQTFPQNNKQRKEKVSIHLLVNEPGLRILKSVKTEDK